MNGVEQSRQVIQQLIPQLEADGYTVYLDPLRQLLPPFMQGYVPDAIALGTNKNLAIEVIVDGAPANDKARHLKDRFEGAPDWELRVYYARPAGSWDILLPVSTASIDDTLSSVEKLVAEGQGASALLLAWAVVEALGRRLLPDKLTRPQGALNLVEALAADGHITPSEAKLLRALASQRNSVAHGKLDQTVDPVELLKLIEVLRELRALLP